MPFIQNIWYPALNSAEIKLGKPVAIKLVGKKIVLYRKEDGAVAALEDRCSHRLAPLSIGRVKGDRIMCMYHGLEFDGAGACVAMPGQDVAKGFDVLAYPVVEQENVIWLWPGDKILADAALIPANPLSDPTDNIAQGVLTYACHYELINDNLTDFSHVSYVHENTVGRNLDEWSQRHPEVVNIEGGVNISRWIVNEGQLPLPGHPPKVDLWQTYEYLVPGVMKMWMEYYPVGTAERLDHTVPDAIADDAIYTSYFFQTATPIDEDNTRFLWGITAPKRFGDVAHSLTIAIVQEAFAEDKWMIEAQHQSLKDHPDIRLRNTAHDRALARIRRMIEQQIKAETRSYAMALE